MFQLCKPFEPSGDQPKAIRQLVDGFRSGAKSQTLLGVTGSGKTFTMANVIQELQRPTLVLSTIRRSPLSFTTSSKRSFRITPSPISSATTTTISRKRIFPARYLY